METLILVIERRDDATPTFASPPDTLYAIVGMETMMSYDIIIDDITNVTVVPLTVLPAGVTLDPLMMTSNDTGECDDVYLKVTVQLKIF